MAERSARGEAGTDLGEGAPRLAGPRRPRRRPPRRRVRLEPPNRNHPSGAFFGAAASGASFRAFLENRPIYVHPKNSLAGAYMDYFAAHRLLTWKPELDYSHLHADQQRYGTIHSIGGSQHEDVILGIQNWIGRSAAHAPTLAADEPDPAVRRNLLEIAEMNDWLVAQPLRTFREACEWLAWFQMAASRETTRSSWQSWETVPAARRWRCSRRG